MRVFMTGATGVVGTREVSLAERSAKVIGSFDSMAQTSTTASCGDTPRVMMSGRSGVAVGGGGVLSPVSSTSTGTGVGVGGTPMN